MVESEDGLKLPRTTDSWHKDGNVLLVNKVMLLLLLPDFGGCGYIANATKKCLLLKLNTLTCTHIVSLTVFRDFHNVHKLAEMCS